MVPSKTDKMKKLTPLLKTNFLRYKTLPFSPKRLVNVYGPKNAPCLWLSQWQEIQIFHTVCLRNFLFAEVRVNSRFLFDEIFLVFDFGHFSFLNFWNISHCVYVYKFNEHCFVDLARILQDE